MGYRIAELVELGITAKMLGDAGIEAARQAATGDPEVGETVAVDAGKADLPRSRYGRPLGEVVRVNAKSYTVRLFCDDREVYAQRDALDRCNARSSASRRAQDELLARARAERDNAQAAAELDAGAEPLVVIPCGGAKLDRPALAGELYTGSYHAACRRAAEALTSPDRIRILSARYGLLRLTDPVEPYELRMGQPGSVDAATVRRQAEDQDLVDEAEVVLLAGADYAAVALQVWPHARRPFDGSRGIGDQLARMAAMTASSSRRDTLASGGHDGPPADQEVPMPKPYEHVEPREHGRDCHRGLNRTQPGAFDPRHCARCAELSRRMSLDEGARCPIGVELTFTVQATEVRAGDRLLPERAQVVGVEPSGTDVIKVTTRSAPAYIGRLSTQEVVR
jgi:hypothetical protein